MLLSKCLDLQKLSGIGGMEKVIHQSISRFVASFLHVVMLSSVNMNLYFNSVGLLNVTLSTKLFI